jgi:hypothetical protein
MNRNSKKSIRFHFTPVIGRAKKRKLIFPSNIKYATKQQKIIGHILLEKVFGEDIVEAYKWLSDNSYSGHFSTMNEFDARNVINKLKRILK